MALKLISGKQFFLVFILVIAYTMVGFFRDYVFLNINSQLYKLYFKNYEFSLPGILKVFEGWPYMRLYYFKYVITAGFVGLYFLLSVITIKLWFQDKKKQKWVLYAHLMIIVLAAAVYFAGWISGSFRPAFVLTRQLMGLVQSPFITMILIPALQLDMVKKE